MEFRDIASIASLGSFIAAFFAYLNYRHNRRVRLEDLAEKKRLIHFKMCHSWTSVTPTPQNEAVTLSVANRQSSAITIKDISWHIEESSLSWLLDSLPSDTITVPMKLQSSDEVVISFSPQDIFRIPWLNTKLSWYEKLFYIKSVKVRITLTTGEQYFCDLPFTLRHVLVNRNISNFMLQIIGRWYVYR